MKIVTVVIVFFIAQTQSQTAPPHCTPKQGVTQPGPNDPPIPTLPNTFQTRIEGNIHDKSFTMTAEEYYSDDLNKATLKLTSAGVTTTLIFDYPNDQLFYVNGLNCQISNLTSDDNNLLFGTQSIAGIPHVYSTNGVLHFAAKFGEKYMGTKFVRGIYVDHWQTCLNWTQLNSVFTLDYYFTVRNWTDAIQTPQIPVRAVASGYQMWQNGTQYPFIHYYEYVDFRDELVVDDTIFETPPGVICPGRVQTRKLPQLPAKYHYRQEIITAALDEVQMADRFCIPAVCDTELSPIGQHTFIDSFYFYVYNAVYLVWYDSAYNLVRFDYKNIDSIGPTYSTNPLSEVHDYNTGIRYIRDQVTGNCSAYPISNTSFDVMAGSGSFAANGSYVLHLKNPLQFFYLDNTYTFVGKRKARGAICDVFSSYRTDYMYNGIKTSASFEYYFLDQSYSEYPDDGSTNPTDIPYMLLVTVYSIGENLPDFKIIYNFLDFDYGHPDFSIFDVSACYSEAANLQFKVRFPGQYKKDTDDYIRLKTQMLFAEAMNVSYIRVQDIRLDYDNSNVYLSATLLDRSPAAAQFTLLSGKVSSRQDDLVYDNIASPQACAQKCVDNPIFVCNSFNFCPHSANSGNCRLSRTHRGDGSILNSTTCDLFARVVNGPGVQEKGVQEAYETLKQKIFGKQFHVEVFEDDGTTIDYYAVDIQIIFGWLVKTPVPSLTGQFSYHLEIVVPSAVSAYDADIWYDQDYKLVRYDMAMPSAPFFSQDPFTIVHDFNTGLAYNIDNTLGNCTVNAITSNSFDAKLDKNAALQNGAYVIKMKNPLELFNLNSTYRYAGQRTVRGMLCDVYETTTTSFHVNGIAKSFTSVLQFFFLSDAWSQTPDTSKTMVNRQPIRMDASSTEVGLFFTYNFFDFSEVHPDLSNFDVTKCFTDDQKQHLAIWFSGPYTADFASGSATFIKQVQLVLAQATGVSPLRFQRTELSTSSHGVTVLTTLTEQAPFIDDFTLIPGKQSPHRSAATIQNVNSPNACALLCRAQTNFHCEGFDYCPGQANQAVSCQLSSEHIEDGTKLSDSKTCDHYSRTVNSTDNVQPTIANAMIKLKDVIAKGLFTINLFLPSGKTYTYNATTLSTKILRPGSAPTSILLSHFKKTENNVAYQRGDAAIPGVSIDDCARTCIRERTFDCKSFDYCYKSGFCLMSRLHPDEQPKLVKASASCDMYSRNYLDRYRPSPGKTLSLKADQIVPNINTANLCAKQCNRAINMTCKSFEYCSNTKSCLLLSKHQLDIPATAISSSPVCSFYSREYIDDFQELRGMTSSAGRTLNFVNVSSDACAKLCVENEEFLCQNFAYCGSTGTCLIMADLAKKGKNIAASQSCSVYLRRYFPAGSRFSNGHQTQAQTRANKSSTGYSGGAMAGLAIAMLIIGLGLGAGILFFLNRRKEFGSNDMSMTTNFVKHEEEAS